MQDNKAELKLGRYQHFKNKKQYQVLGAARHSEDLSEYVVYQQLYGDYSIWVRPKAMFLETVEHEGKTIPRFEYLENNFLELHEVEKK